MPSMLCDPASRMWLLAQDIIVKPADFNPAALPASAMSDIPRVSASPPNGASQFPNTTSAASNTPFTRENGSDGCPG